MKWKVKHYISGTVVEQVLVAKDIKDAKTVATALFPTSTIIGISPHL
jgi:hypothetical protein